MSRTLGCKHTVLVLALAGMLFGSVVQAAPVPLSYAGRLGESDDKPLTGTVKLEFRFYRAATGSAPILPDPIVREINTPDGFFQVDFTELSDLDLALIFPDVAQEVWVEVKDVTNGFAYKRQRYSMMPLALRVPIHSDDFEWSNGFLKLKSQGAVASAVNATTAANATTADNVGGKSALEVANTVTAVAGATTSNAVGTIVQRDASGEVTVSKVVADAAVKFRDNDGAGTRNYVSLQGPAALPADVSYTLPAAPLDGKYLTTNAAGVMSWATPAGAGDVTGIINGTGITGGALSGDVTLAVDIANVVTTSSVTATGALMDADFGTDGIMVRTAANTYGILTNSSANWNTAHTDRLKWDGGATGLTPATGRASLGLGALAELAVVGSTEITDSSVAAIDLASDAVTTVKILDANVTAAKLASDAVTTVKILDANVTAAKLASDAVTTVKILDSNVTAAKLASDAVTTAKILDLTITNDDISATAAIAATKIGDGTVSAAEFGYLGAVTSDIQTQLNGKPGVNTLFGLNSYMGTVGNYSLSLKTDSVARLVLAGNGAIEASPLGAFAITGDTAAGTGLLLSDTFQAADLKNFRITNAGTKLKFETDVDARNTASTLAVLDRSGNFGIGTTAPESRLHVEGGDLTIGRIDNTVAPSLMLRRGRSAGAVAASGDVLGSHSFAGYRGSLAFNTGAEITATATEAFSSGSAGSKLGFSTAANGTPSLTERMVIDSNGAVGIGTSAPSAMARLHVKGGSNYGLLVEDGGGAPIMVAAASGNVGIGTTSPSAQLDVAGTAKVGATPPDGSTLSVAMDSTIATLTLASGTGFPPAGILMIDGEAIYYSTVSGSTFSGLSRGYNGTVPSPHTVGAPVRMLALQAEGALIVKGQVVSDGVQLGKFLGASVGMTSGVAATSTASPILFGTESFDTDDFHNTASFTDRLVAPRAGYYEITADVEFQSGSTTNHLVEFTLNNNATGFVSKQTPSLGKVRLETLIKLNQNDYIQIRQAANTGTLGTYIGTATIRFLGH